MALEGLTTLDELTVKVVNETERNQYILNNDSKSLFVLIMSLNDSLVTVGNDVHNG